MAYRADDGTELSREQLTAGAPHLRMVGSVEYLWLSSGSFHYIFAVADGRLAITQKLDGRAIVEAPLPLAERDAIVPLESGIARVILKVK